MLRASAFPLLAIDPGLNALGWALWRLVKKPKQGESLIRPPSVTGVITTSRKLTPWNRLQQLLLRLETDPRQLLSANTVAVELASFRAGDAVGHSAASRGDLGFLYIAVGAHAQQAWSRDIRFVPVPVQEWKGQLPKKATAARIERAIGLVDGAGNEIKSHAIDAVGIGLHVMGFKLDDVRYFGR